MREEKVVLVDGNDEQLGLMPVLEAHKHNGQLHRAVSVVLHDGEGNVLIQRRSKKKMLWPKTWSNTICTHPREEEGYEEAAVRRLNEELGIEIKKKELKSLYRFQYKAKYISGDEIPGFSVDGLAEHELDTVIVGEFSGEVEPNSDEVSRVKWIAWDDLKEDIERHPDMYTPWFKLMVDNGKLDKVIG